LWEKNGSGKKQAVKKGVSRKMKKEKNESLDVTNLRGSGV